MKNCEICNNNAVAIIYCGFIPKYLCQKCFDYEKNRYINEFNDMKKGFCYRNPFNELQNKIVKELSEILNIQQKN